MKSFTVLAASTAVVLLSGCASTLENPPMVFGKSLTVGIGISASAPEQGGDFTLGVSSKNIAVVPVTVTQNDKAHTQIQSTSGKDYQDALSVLGQFHVDAQNGPKVGLGEFFATGLAAKKLADGFACQLSGNSSCSPHPVSPGDAAPKQ